MHTNGQWGRIIAGIGPDDTHNYNDTDYSFWEVSVYLKFAVVFNVLSRIKIYYSDLSENPIKSLEPISFFSFFIL